VSVFSYTKIQMVRSDKSRAGDSNPNSVYGVSLIHPHYDIEVVYIHDRFHSLIMNEI
jgi:hypothetical protein